TMGKVLATSAVRRAAIHDAKLAPKLEVETDRDIVDMAIENDKSLILAFPNGIQRAKLGGKAPKLEYVARTIVARLAASGHRIYGATEDAVVRIHDDPEGKVAEGVHHSHVCMIAALHHGSVVTK